MRTPISGDMFIDQVLTGRTDFTELVLESGFELNRHERWGALQTFLEGRPADAPAYDFSGSQWSDVKARGWHMPHSVWTGAELGGADLVECNFDLSDFSGASIKKANLGRAKFTGAQFTGAHLESSNLEEAKLEGANFWKARLANVIFVKCLLRDSLICEADCQGTDFTDADLTAANLWGSRFGESQWNRALLWKTQLKGVLELDLCHGLTRARFRKTRLGKKERESILKAFDRFAFDLVD